MVNGSVCGSPFLVGGVSGSTTSGAMTNSTQSTAVSGGTNSNATVSSSSGPVNSLLSPTSTFSNQYQTAHHLRGLSFTPLAVDSDLSSANTNPSVVDSVNSDPVGVLPSCTSSSPIKTLCTTAEN
ncbi:unnamed protein product, partial [Echinostoma caproni]